MFRQRFVSSSAKFSLAWTIPIGGASILSLALDGSCHCHTSRGFRVLDGVLRRELPFVLPRACDAIALKSWDTAKIPLKVATRSSAKQIEEALAKEKPKSSAKPLLLTFVRKFGDDLVWVSMRTEYGSSGRILLKYGLTMNMIQTPAVGRTPCLRRQDALHLR
jgi:hypothetical protein